MEKSGDKKEYNLTPDLVCDDAPQFYELGDRGPLLKEVQQAVFDSVAVVTILGAEGSGKTVLCEMVKKNLDAQFHIIFYRSAVRSFEDVIRSVALKVGMSIDSEIKRGELNDLLVQILEVLEQDNKKLLIIFDNAEKIFLATLERIRKMLDLLNENGLYFQVLFSGEDSLQANLQQLSLCTFQGATERVFPVEPISEEETFGYLNYYLTFLDTEKKSFSREESRRIFDHAQGNFVKTNDEAKQLALDVSSNQTISLPIDTHHKRKTHSRKKTKRIPSLRWRWRPGVFSGLCVLVFIVIVVVILLKPDNHSELVDQNETEEQVVVEQVVLQPQEQQVTEIVQTIVKEPSGETQKRPIEQKERIAVEPPIKTLVESKAVDEISVGEQKTVVDQGDIDIKLKQIGQKESQAVDPAANTIESQPFIVIRSESNRFVSSEADSSGGSSDFTPRKSVGELFNQRVVAATKWSMNIDKGLYTIQLMVLTAEHAEENVKKQLMRPEYQDIAEDIFILRSLGPPPSVYVFYGEFQSKVMARTARNNLPIFLRKHDPYVTSIKNAIEKVGAEKRQ